MSRYRGQARSSFTHKHGPLPVGNEQAQKFKQVLLNLDLPTGWKRWTTGGK